MGFVYDRKAGQPGQPVNLYLSYDLTPALQAKFGFANARRREPAGTKNREAAERLLAKREQAVAHGTWQPWSMDDIAFEQAMRIEPRVTIDVSIGSTPLKVRLSTQ